MGDAWMAYEEECNADLELRRLTGYRASVDTLDRLAALGGPGPEEEGRDRD